jgi:hypothetical protein
MAFESHLEPFLEPLRQRIEKLEDRLRRTEATLAQVLKIHPVPLVEEIVPALQSISFIAQPGPYAYQPLDPASDEIRVLVLYPSQDEQDSITCDLLHASLNDVQQLDHSDRLTRGVIPPPRMPSPSRAMNSPSHTT